jgi:hypothetical protein
MLISLMLASLTPKGSHIECRTYEPKLKASFGKSQLFWVKKKVKERVKEIGFTVAVVALLLIGELHL